MKSFLLNEQPKPPDKLKLTSFARSKAKTTQKHEILDEIVNSWPEADRSCPEFVPVGKDLKTGIYKFKPKSDVKDKIEYFLSEIEEGNLK